MNGLGKRASFLALAAVLATALLGSAYSLWFEQLQVNETVSTGNLDGLITCAQPVDNEINAPIGGGFWSTVLAPQAFYPVASPLKDVASAPTGTQNGPHEFDVSVSNTYPGYMEDCELHLVNTGTVPWHIEVESITVLENGVPILTGTCPPLNPNSPGSCTAGDISPTNPAGKPLYVKFLDLRGCQLHEDNERIGSLFIGVNQSAHESTNYTVKLQFQVNQWNESGYSGCGQLRPGNTGPLLPQIP